MRRLWCVVSLILVFVFTASASYIYFALADSPKEVDEPYMALGTPVTQLAAEVKTVLPEVQLTIRETYPACGHTQEEVVKAAESDMLGLAFDELALAGWSVAQIGEQRLLLEREQEGFVRRRRLKGCFVRRNAVWRFMRVIYSILGSCCWKCRWVA